ncbi:hypothetical protein U9M48_001413 [Paspalum notatum var. saurae]|uniref:Ubiquitin-like protease family profile domain-containing protein n=1 Tax=Paspalum notatum var. saurae TaxID=547442 RepID=A0AAQ3PI95_PASNO
MQAFIDCMRHDDASNLPAPITDRLILDVDVGLMLSTEEQEMRSKDKVGFKPEALTEYLQRTVPWATGLIGRKSIMLPMLHRGHWTLYVVNLVRRCIDIYDSNPYGLALGGTNWKAHHCNVVEADGKRITWCKLMMSRLNKCLQAARPNCGLPKFGNWKIDISPHCHTMEAGSNNCSFFVTRFVQLYDHNSGSLHPWNWPEDDGDLRSFLLQYLTFHPVNQLAELPPEIERFRPPRV